jgi:hypothetical protein
MLPKSGSIPSLTSKNLVDVSGVYLRRILRGRDLEQGEKFIEGSLCQLMHRESGQREACKARDDIIEKMLHYIPHCAVGLDKDYNHIWGSPVFEKWCGDCGVEFELFHHKLKSYYLFKTEEERILFKLRWL